nr:unnamed protein product [Callosobruchus analis]
MDKKKKEADMLMRRCKASKTRRIKAPTLEEIIATQLTDDLMDQFKINKQKREKLKEFQSEFTKKTKLKEFKTRLVPLYPEVPKKNDCHKKIRYYSELCPYSDMTAILEAALRNQVQARGLENRYPSIIDNIVAEAKVEFLEVTHTAGVNLKTKPMNMEEYNRTKIEPYKYLARSERYSVYLWTRNEFQVKFMLHLPLVQRIFKDCINVLPPTLFNISTLRSKPYDIKELDDIFTRCINEAEVTLKRFYYKIVEMVEVDDTKLEPYLYKRMLKVCTGVLSKYISIAIMNTMEHIRYVTGSDSLIPYIKLSLKYSGESLVLFPNENDVILIYSMFVSKLVDIGRTFLVLETVRIRDYPTKNIHLNVTDEFFNDTLELIGENIMNMFVPVNDYMSRLEEDFQEIFRRFSVVEDESNPFQSSLNQIKHYQNYMNKVGSMLSSEYFGIGQLVLSEYVQSMRESLSEVIEDLFIKLCVLHQEENEDICDCFEAVKEEALRRPATSEELIAQGKYMIWVKTVHLIELRERIQQMLYNLTDLILYGTLEKDHLELNAKTVNWLKGIEPILDINSSIGREYVNAIKLYMVELRDLRAKITWINKEQLCLGFNVSPFKNVEEVENFVYPFFHLLKLCMNIKRHINVWLDGQFEFLSYEKTEETVEEQAQAENTAIRFFGVVDDPDLNSWPAPLKLAAMAIQALKDFRPAMTIMRIMCNDALMKRHWKEMSAIAGFELTPNAGSSLRKYTEMGESSWAKGYSRTQGYTVQT